MITIEGLGGKGTLWCLFKNPNGMALPVNPGYSVFGSFDDGIKPVSPFECYLPPVGGANVWYDCAASPYGPRVTKVDVGTLVGATKSPDVPNPCQQSTIVGTLSKASADPLQRLNFVRPYVGPVAGETWHTPNGAVAQFLQGYGSTYKNYTRTAYNRYGALVPFSIETSNAAMWNDPVASLTDCVDPAGTSSPTYVNGAKQGMILSKIVLNENFPQANYLRRHTCVHVSPRVWEHEGLYEYHFDASYTPRSSVSKETGYGFLVSSVTRKRTYTMTHIQSVVANDFRARFTVHEEMSWYGYQFGPGYYAGSAKSDYTFVTSILVMFPGKSVGGSLPLEIANAYCASAIERAMLLYKCGDATTARSSAISDVPGLESNWLENLSQVGGTADVILPLLAGWKAFKHGDLFEAKRALAGAYLSYKYVIAPGVRDYKDVKGNLGTLFKGFTRYRFSNERRRGILHLKSAVLETSANLTHSCTLNLKLKDNPYAAVFNALEKLGLDPSAGNIWDLIPFSFVADWFLHIGPALSSADALQNNVVLRDVTNRIESFKVQWPLTNKELLGFGWTDLSVLKPLNYTWYDRRILSGLGSFDALAGQKRDGLSVSQMTQGAALLSSYKK